MIELRQVSKTYNVGSNVFHALCDVQLTIVKNECVAIVGPSGSGKSTMMHIMGLLDTPTQGDYYLDGQLTKHFNHRTRALYRNQKIGFIFQQFFLLSQLTVLENVALPLYYRRISKKEREVIAIDMLTRVGMTSQAYHKPSELSGGQQQRVAIARALVGKPSIILADEPTGALDRRASQAILDLLKTFVTEATVVIITHDVSIARQCPRQLHVLNGFCGDGY